MENVGRLLVITGILFIAVGGVLLLAGKAGWLGRLPGDIRIERDGFSIFIPVATSILLSLVLTLLFNLLWRRR